MLVEVLRRPPGVAHPPTVLLVDDEPDILEGLRHYLEATMPGTRVLIAPCAEDALPLIEQGEIDVIVSDLRMPGMDGIELLRRVGRQFPKVRKILITAFHEADLDTRAEDAGVGALLRKPF